MLRPASPRPHSRHSALWLMLCNVLLSQAALAAPPALELPIRCQLGLDCFIQNYFDHDPASGWRDYSCGQLSYDGHTGTDFRLPGMAAMRQGVDVLAAADGIVAGLRDGEPDIPVLMRAGQPDSGKHAAGNGVRIDHGDGWETQYSHMMKGSITVRSGQIIHAGDRLGRVGLSGNTEFPHVDFSVMHNGQPVDPFSPDNAQDCGASAASLWKPTLLDSLRYVPTGILQSGWSGEVPVRNKLHDGEYKAAGSDSAALVFWIELFGVQAGDRQSFEIFGPQGVLLLNSGSVIPGYKAVWFTYAGKPGKGKAWATGTYRARYRLTRNGKAIIEAERDMEVH